MNEWNYLSFGLIYCPSGCRFEKNWIFFRYYEQNCLWDHPLCCLFIKKRFTLHRICAHIYIYTYKDNATRHSRVCKPCQYIYSAAPAPSIGPFFVLQLVCKFFWMENCVVGFMFSWLRLAPFGIWQTVRDRQGAHYFQFWKTVVQTALSRTATA